MTHVLDTQYKIGIPLTFRCFLGRLGDCIGDHGSKLGEAGLSNHSFGHKTRGVLSGVDSNNW